MKVGTLSLKIIVLKYRNMGVGLVFENSLVYPPGQNILKSSFFYHIWTHLPGVNGFLLEPFMTCNVISRSLCFLSYRLTMALKIKMTFASSIDVEENCCIEYGNKSSKFSEAHYYAIRHSKWSFNLLSWILLLLHCMEEECTTEYILLPKAISWRSTKEPSLSCNLIPSIADPFLHSTFLPSKCSFQKAIWALCVLLFYVRL